MSIDPQVKYRDERLPRYTSYPTAPHFSPDDIRRQLSRLAPSVPVRQPALDLPACPVLPIHVLVLRVPHVRDEARLRRSLDLPTVMRAGDRDLVAETASERGSQSRTSISAAARRPS